MKLITCIFLTLFSVTLVHAKEFSNERYAGRYKRIKVINGMAVTGANMRLGQPVWDLGDGLGRTAFSFVFGYNSNGSEPLDLTEFSPGNTILATGLDSNFLNALGLSADDFNPNPVNIPFHKVPVISNPFTADRSVVAPATQITGSTLGRSVPTNPVTLRQWLKASGRIQIECDKDNGNVVVVKAKGLVPNGIYTVWALFGDDSNGDGLEDRMVPSALGGVPNVVIPDAEGNATFKRKLGFCPMIDKHLKLVDVTYHSDGNVFGGTVDMFLPGFAGFAVTNTHVAFPINAKPIN